VLRLPDLITLDRERFRVSPWLILPAGLAIGIGSGTFSYLVQRWINPEVVNYPMGQYAWVVTFNIFSWTGWLALVPVVLWLSRTFRFTRETAAAATVVHLGAALSLTIAHCVFAGTVRWAVFHLSGQKELIPTAGDWLSAVKIVALYAFEWEVLLYGGLVAMQHAIRSHRELQQRAVSESRLEARLIEAQLESLQRQLQPHFLFNTLHAVAGLVHRDPDAAESMIVRLGDLLRAVFRSNVQQEVSLARELELLDQYLEIQRLRFGPGLRTSVEVAEDVIDARVPVLLLQPLVENAIKHGFARRADGGLVQVRAFKSGSQVTISVADNGRGVGSMELRDLNEGVGLSNTRARLEHLYGDAHSIAFDAPSAGGFAVTINLPYFAAPGEEIPEPPLQASA
jgi:signal transduction histidine kinase